MAEKRGSTVKINFDFNTAAELEVYIDNWYRVTPNEFRSFDGKRRYSQPSTLPKLNREVEIETVDYYGPVYLYKTTVEVQQLGLNTVVRDLSKHIKFK